MNELIAIKTAVSSYY